MIKSLTSKLWDSAGRSVVSAAALLLATSLPSFGEDNRYELRSGDEVKITVFKEPDMSGVFRIGTTGTVSVPGIGELKSAGLTSSELRDAAIEALAARHYANPSVTVEIAQYSPVFVMGDVRNPGRHSYTPGMTALQLVAVAGGYPLPPAFTESTNLNRDQERYRADLALSRERFATLSMRRARLMAERDGMSTFSIPSNIDGMVSPERLEQIRVSEMHLLTTQAEEAQRRTELLHKQAEEIQKGRTALEEQLEATKRLKIIVDTELRNIRDLKERGLTANTRVLELERISADTEMRINSGISMISEANQSLVGIDLQIRQSMETSRIRIAEQLIQAETDIAVANRQMVTAVEFLNASGAVLPSDLPAQAEIIRHLSVFRDGSSEAVPIAENEPVRPGDVLTVTRAMGIQTAGKSKSPAGPPTAYLQTETVLPLSQAPIRR